MIDLSQENLPIVKEVSALNILRDAENHVLTGIDTGLRNNYSTSHIAVNYVCLKVGGSQFTRDDLFRSFTELDLEEMKRVRKL